MLRMKPKNNSRKIKPLIDLELDCMRLESVLCKICLSLFWGKYSFTILPATDHTCVIAPDRRESLYYTYGIGMLVMVMKQSLFLRIFKKLLKARHNRIMAKLP